jgi:hypothetical protein
MRTLLVTCVLCMAAVAAADPPKRAAELASDDCAKQRKAGKTCVLSIESEQITGDHPQGGDVGVAAIRFTNAGSLIHLRREFMAEIIKTAEDL